MKWNIIVSTVVLGFGLCAPSYGFDLLDRMLGAGGCGCETQCCDPCGPASCCDKGPSCCDAGPSCCQKKSCHRRGGLLGGCRSKGCCQKPSCCAPACEPSCCAPVCEPSCCQKVVSCCDPCGDKCGCEPACKPSCKRPCLLERIFSCNRKSCCKSSCCDSCTSGCNGCSVGCTTMGGGKAAPAPAMEGDEMAPMPPAPVVDPSAYLPAKRRVVHASTTLVR